MVVQVFDLLQVTTLLKSVVFILFLSLMASRLSIYFKFVFFVSHREQANRRTVADIFKAPVASMIWILKCRTLHFETIFIICVGVHAFNRRIIFFSVFVSHIFKLLFPFFLSHLSLHFYRIFIWKTFTNLLFLICPFLLSFPFISFLGCFSFFLSVSFSGLFFILSLLCHFIFLIAFLPDISFFCRCFLVPFLHPFLLQVGVYFYLILTSWIIFLPLYSFIFYIK